MMRAVMIRTGGGPEVLQMGNFIKPEPQPGFVLIRVMAFGINRSDVMARELYQSQTYSARVLGIEAVGAVEFAPGGEYLQGRIVATAMGYLGGQRMGSYAEYICVPVKQVLPLSSGLSWARLAAMPQMFQVAYGSLFKALCVKRGENLLIRGGTTSVGLAATALASHFGVNVTATTRNEAHRQMIMSVGASRTYVDSGSIASIVARLLPQKYDKVLELVGTATLQDSMHCAKAGGIVCLAGMVGGGRFLPRLEPMGFFPHAVSLTTYCGDDVDFIETPLQDLVDKVETGELTLPLAKVFRLEEIAHAHRFLEENHGLGKIVVTL